MDFITKFVATTVFATLAFFVVGANVEHATTQYHKVETSLSTNLNSINDLGSVR